MELAGDLIVDVPSITKGEYITKARQILRDDIYREIYVLDTRKKPIGYINITDVLKVAETKSNITIDGYLKDAPLVHMDQTHEEVAKTILTAETDSCAVLKQDNTYAGAIRLADLFPLLACNATPCDRVQDIMTRKTVTTTAKTTIQKVYSLITESGYNAIPVLDNHNELIGIISRRDLLSGSIRTALINETQIPVEKIMKTELITIHKDASIAEAAQKMLDSDISRIPVTENGRLIGIIDRFDVLKNIL